MNKAHRTHNIIITVLSILLIAMVYVYFKTKSKKDKVMVIMQNESLSTQQAKLNWTLDENTAGKFNDLNTQRKLLADSLKIVQNDTFPQPPKAKRLFELNEQIYNLDQLMVEDAIYEACSASVASVPVQLYTGNMSSVSTDFCNKHSLHVGLLQWGYEFPNSVKNLYTEGNIKGKKIGTGCLIAKDLFLTAGHNIVFKEGDTTIPKYNGKMLTTNQAVPLMFVIFNYEIDAATGKIRSDTMRFPVLSVEEYPIDNNDYSILRLGENKGQFPGDVYNFEHFSGKPPKLDDVAAIIEQPDESEDAFTKRICAAPSTCSNEVRILYPKIATEPAASGSPVFSYTENELVGIHIGGDCQYYSGHGNQGISINSLLPVSKTLRMLTSQKN